MKLNTFALFATSTLAVIIPSVRAQSPASAPLLADKTLVVWVAPANLTQRGGSALTITDASDRFDGMVFGELPGAKWMAGSEMFSRTPKEQEGFPAETADAKTFVQMAMVYHGREVTAYRDGRKYSQHIMAGEPLEFGAQCFALIGKRHRRQGTRRTSPERSTMRAFTTGRCQRNRSPG